MHQKDQIRQGIELLKPYSMIAEELEMTVRTVKKWGQKIKRGENLCPQMGRPKVGVLGSFDSQIIKKIDEYRPNEQGWGAITIAIELELDSELDQRKKTFVQLYKQVFTKYRPYQKVPQSI